MSTDSNTTQTTQPEPTPEQVRARIAASDSSHYFQALERIQATKVRLWQAALQNGTPEENEAAWREFSTLAARVFRRGRLWTPVWVYYLAPLLLAIDAEQDQLERVEAAYQAVGDDEIAGRRIDTEVYDAPTLAVVDVLIDAVQANRDEGRRIAGYLSEDCQPSA